MSIEICVTEMVHSNELWKISAIRLAKRLFHFDQFAWTHAFECLEIAV